jgi:hypothetical protein
MKGLSTMSKIGSIRQMLLLGIFATALAGACAPAMADTAWQKAHPRREQVNHRLHHQNARIKHDVKAGDLSKSKARQLHHDDRKIRHEERDMASMNNGHITKQEQGTLNRQENAVSSKIGR